MSNSLNLSLTDELKNFVQENSGNGTLYSTPSEYVRDLIRYEKERKEAQDLRNGIIQGYQDVINERTVPLSGDLKSSLKKHLASKKNG